MGDRADEAEAYLQQALQTRPAGPVPDADFLAALLLSNSHDPTAGSLGDAKVAAFAAHIAEAEHQQRYLRHTRSHARAEACIAAAGQSAPPGHDNLIDGSGDVEHGGCTSRSSGSQRDI